MPVSRSKHSPTTSRNNKKARLAKSRPADSPELSNDRVEQALHRRATGFNRIKTTIKVIGGKPVMFKHHEDVPPDVNAAKFWATNRQPRRWKQPKPEQIKGATEDDPFMAFLRSINGNVIRPVDDPPPRLNGPTRPVSDDDPPSPPDDTNE